MKLSKKLRAIPDGRPWFYFGEEADAIILEIEQLERDSELGALVRRMPHMSALAYGVTREGTGKVWNYCKRQDQIKTIDWIGYSTPEEALREALGAE
jgi:hypothetical protein